MKLVAFLALILAPVALAAQDSFQAGAAAVDVTPTKFPVIVNGMFTTRTGTEAHDRLQSRALVLDDGETKIAIVVVDSLMMPRDLIDKAKAAASKTTGIPVERMLVSATHTHSAPSAMGCLGTDIDPDYVAFLPGKIAESIELANQQLQGAKVGWASVNDYEHNHCRRWIFRSAGANWTGGADPFGRKSVAANMHPGYQSQKHIGPSGPADPALTLLAVLADDDKPIAVLANYANHYFGGAYVSAGFSGKFGTALGDLIGADDSFVGLMSQGTSGDSMWMDYGKAKISPTVDEYTAAVAKRAKEAWDSIEFHDSLPITMEEAMLTLKRRVPDEERLKWARQVATTFEGRLPKSRPEVYAREQIFLAENPDAELKLQAIRIGNLGISAIPNEVYGITGLKIRRQNPLDHTMNIELANGAEGYIPPPEQHHLGGYTTWEARTAGLEIEAEPRIVETLLTLFENLSAEKRVDRKIPLDAYAKAVLKSKPYGFWRLDEMSGAHAIDNSGNGHAADFEPGVVFHLPGRNLEPLEHIEATVNRGVHLARGGRIRPPSHKIPNNSTVEFWFWNGIPNGEREVLGHLLGFGNETIALFGDGQLKLAGVTGTSKTEPRQWRHLALVNDQGVARIYLDGVLDLEAKILLDGQIWFGGSADGKLGLEGKLDDIALYPHALSEADIKAHFQAAKP
ncbi:MAG: hypothetical protein ACI8UO_004237 [Verrucomicrobiales bacterium]|jgi:hypothetical protein